MTSNTALADELEAVNSIYDDEIVSVVSHDPTSTVAVLKLPTLPFSFSITFPDAYPDIPPQVNGTQSTGPNTKKGEGEAALNTLRDVLGQIFAPGQVCLFDLVEEVTPLLQTPTSEEPTQHAGTNGPPQDPSETAPDRSDTLIASMYAHDLTEDAATIPPPNWTLSDPLVVNKSTFVARALRITSVPEATQSITHLLSTNKRVAGATHNITAWRVRSRPSGPDGPEVTAQDCDDDGETAAGGRLLHLLQLMDAWDVLVVVTRWYGGVKLGPDRFRCINMVARESLVRGGFGPGESGQGRSSTTAKEKGKAKKK